jgi:Domain of unknown function (DUF5606)
MEYNKIIAVTGLPGLFELVSSKTDGAIVRSLEDKSTKFVASRVHNFSHLESIEIFTQRDNVNLVEIFQAMDAGKSSLPDGKDAAVLKAYFLKVYPDMDFERVYSSDMKKMVKWFEVLKNNNIEFKLAEETPEAAVAAAVEEEKPAEIDVAKKKAPVKKETAKKAPAAEKEAEAPVKKTVRKKKTEE